MFTTQLNGISVFRCYCSVGNLHPKTYLNLNQRVGCTVSSERVFLGKKCILYSINYSVSTAQLKYFPLVHFSLQMWSRLCGSDLHFISCHHLIHCHPYMLCIHTIQCVSPCRQSLTFTSSTHVSTEWQ